MNQANVSKALTAELNCELAVAQAIALIKSYSFDTNGNSAEILVQQWLNYYQGNWIRLAAIEALYLGRYKSVSIEQIMEVWIRIGTPNIHFKGEFERLICRKLPKYLVMSDYFWLNTEESLLSNVKENSNSDSSQYRQSHNSLSQESSFSAEPIYSKKINTKTLADIKDILKQKGMSQPQLNIKQTNSCSFAEEKIDLSKIHITEEQNIQATKNFENNLTYHSTTITNFHPIIDNSAFFNKLKSLALARI